MSVFRRLLGALVGRGDAAPAPAGIERAEVERRAAARDLTVEGVLARPQACDIYDERFRTFCAENAQALRGGLKDRIGGRPAGERIAAARILGALGDPAAENLLLDVVGAPMLDAADRERALLALRALPRGAGDAPASIDPKRALRVLEPWLRRGAVHMRRNAAEILFRLVSPEIDALKRALLDDPTFELRLAAAHRLAREKNAAAWPFLRDLMVSADPAHRRERYWAIRALTDLAGGEDAAVRSAIADLCARQIEAQLDRSDNATANEIWNLMGVIEAAAAEWEAELLARIIAAGVERWTRGAALKRLATLQGASALPTVSAALDDPAMRPDAMAALAEIGAEAAQPAIVERLRAVIAAASEEREADLAIRALEALGQGDDPAITANLAKLSPWERFERRVRSISGAALLDRLIEAELLTPERLEAAAPETLAAFRDEPLDRGGLYGDLLGLLHDAKALHVFDTEDDQVPPDYPALLDALAEIARPRFSIDSVSMRGAFESGPGIGRHEVLFLFDGEPTRFLAADRGDWLDVGGVLGHLNGLIARAGRPERFLTLHSGDQLAYVVLANGEKALSLQREIGFPLAEDPDAPMRAGQAFERHVIERLEREG